jgi:hypothetical protein
MPGITSVNSPSVISISQPSQSFQSCRLPFNARHTKN